VLDDVSAPVVLTQQRFASDAALDKVNVLCLDSQWDSLSEESSTNPDARASLDSLAYIIYTSGSTGTPKGVMNHHRGISNRLLWMQETYRATSSDVVLQKTPYSFDVSVWELFWPLISGARLIMAEPGSHRESFSLSRLISLREITIAHFVPSMLQVFLDEPSLDGCQSLRLVVCSGEALTLELQDRFFKLLGSQLHNLYGPTEAAVDVTFWQCSQSGRKAVPIGRPIANTKIYLLDADSRPAPIGVPGQLHIGGVCLARGYYGNPAQTAEKFVPDPFSPAGARLYATGDLARYAADGNIEFLGRLDHQVKIRGMRIEMSEIETVLNQWPPIKEAIVTAREDGPGNQCLVAYLVAHSGIEVETDSLRRYLRDHLPEHMIPSILMTVDRFTLTANGKVDRRALPVPERSSYERRLRHTPAQTPIQQEVARVWKSVLRVNRPGIYENFLELGGHSLLATQVISRLRNTFQVELSLRSLFESPTIAGLAGEIETLLRGAQAHRLPPITPLSRQGDLPLSFAQQRLWFLDQFEPESYAYNMPGIVRLAGKLDVSALEQSLNEVIRRHESLRAVFTSTGGQPSQRISPIRQLRLGVIDLSGLPEALREDQVSRLSIEAARRPFDLAKGPLIREKLLRLSDERHVLLLTMHHIVSDGWSLGVLLEEMVAFYEALSGGKPFAMPEPPVQYTDFAQWQQQWLRGEVLERQLSYWKQQLGDDPPPLELPTDRPRLNSFTVRGAREGFSLSHNLSEDIRSLGQRESATLFMVLLAAFQTLLHRYGGRNDILVGSPIAGRNHFELERLIGFFVNTVVVRGDLSGDPGFRTLLNRVRETALEAYAHQDVPFEKVVEAVQPARTLMHTPLFQVMFDLQEAITPEIKLADLTLSGLETDNGAAKFDLTLTMADSPSAIEATVEYNSDLFDAPTISRMVDHFKVLLKGILADPDKNISSLPLLTDAEQHQLLVEWNSNHAAYPEQVCIHQLFEEQAERNPDKVAVVYEQQQFTYGEMNQQANRLAHRLLADGVGPDRCVGIYMYRSPEAILAVLATLKAGGTYLPLDPTYANDRLAFMLRDSRACLTITTADLFSQLPAPEIKAIPFNMSLIGDELHVNKATPSSEVTSRNMAYVVYTSGSTGLPKGVMVTHHSLVNAFYGWEKAYSLSSSATSHLQIAGFGFDVFSGDWVRALCSGAKLVLCPFEVLLNAERLYRLMREEQLDCGEFTPATLTHLGRYLQESGKKLDFMRLLIVGSDTWHIQKHEQLRRLCGNDTRLINSYGLTETTIDSSYFEGDFSYRSTEDTVPIGRPFANTGMYLLDWHAQPVPIGVAAEGYIGGPSLTRGYLNRADLTAASFIPNPFSDAPGERLYRTGDLGRFLPNGNIAFLGRADAQVKIRGLRIELGEIEAALGGHTDIEDCVVLARALSLTEKQLVAFITLKQGANTSTNDFRRFLKKSLPDYMLPAAFVVLDKLPVTPNGKVDRGALQAAEITLPERRVGFITPSSATERSVAEIWSGVLGIEQVGALDDFFGLGGHSLLAAQVVSRLNRAFKIEITIRELFAESTVAGLSALIEQKQLQQADDDKLALMLAEVNELSDEEAEALLAAEEMLSKET
jgi:amino acid adenylation domain-containing protein